MAKKKICIAKLDNALIYKGTDMIDEDKLKQTDVVIPVDCDLEKGGYKYDLALKQFVPTTDFIKRKREEKTFHRKTKREKLRIKNVTA